MATLKAKDIQLAVTDDQLRVQGNKQALSDPAVLALLREHKAALIELIKAGGYAAAKHGQVEVPANGIVPGTTRITPAMVTLAELSQDTLDHLVADVPGGAENVQDIYPLAPLQEGILFHHVSGGEGDPYVMQAQFAFTDMQRFQAFAQALQTVINRHDILRTAVVWEGLDAPLQVVWRRAHLPLEEFVPQDGEADALAQLNEHFDPRHFRLDVSRAPMVRLAYAQDTAGQRIIATLLFHHMAMDHSALEVVSHEMRECLSGQGARLGRPVPFRNYVAQARLGISEAEHEAFFRDMLGDIDEPTLPFGLQDVQGDGQGIAELGMPVEAELGQRLRTQARQLGVSAASLFHLAWAQVLATLTGKPSVVFGTVLMGRLQGAEAIDRALGIFINTLPVRLDIDGQGVRAAVQATHARLTTLMRHEHAPLALAQRCSQVAAPTPLFSALFNYRHSHGAAAAHAQAQTAWEGITNLHAEERSNYPLTLSVDDFGDAFRLMLLASTQLDPQRVCGYMHSAVEGLVQALEQTPDLPVHELSVLPTAEREQVLFGFNATAADYPQGLTTQQRFEAQAAQRPDAVAAAFLGEQLTYAGLNRRANALARHLTGLGVRPDDRVAIVARRGLDTLVGLVAILKAGAGYVPVDPAHPAERLEYLLGDSAPVAVLTQSGLRGRLPALEVPVLDLDLAQWPSHDAGNPQIPGLTPGHLAYVIYTSGSTGLPKGVMVEHKTLGNLIDWHCAAFDLCAGRHTSSLAGFGFDAMAWEVWPALCAGATLHLAPVHDGTEDIDALLGWWRGQPLDVSFLPTPVAEYAFGQSLEHPTLRTLLIGGDRLRQFGRSQTFDVINNYGPTEATVVATSGLIEAGQTLHIGRPVANATVYLLDEQQRPVPIGVAGELYVGGAGVARGYLNRPELTEERFLQDPFNPGRMYRTGDLARWREDGSIEYLGRNDDQVKIRGVRIELGEIENCLNHLPGIQEAVLLAREDEPGQVRLVAYFTAQAQVEPLEVGELRTHLLSQLPEYMVPSAFVRLDALPLTANGKLDRKALPKPERSALFTREYEAPQGELEQALAQVWAEVLQVERVGRHDHFFELGGHSLLAMRMVSQVRQRLGVELALSDLFANAELAAVAEVLSRSGRSTLPDIVPAPRDQALPLSFAQQRLWFLSQMEGANTAYNIPIALRLRGRLDEDALQRSLARIVARHETLRSRFAQFNDEAEVLIAPVDSGLPLQAEDLRRHPQAEDALLALIEGEASAPFDLEGDPLIRGRLVRMADDHHVLLLTLHHIVTDGWSMGVLTRELMALYQAFSHGEPDPLPPLALQYTDYAVWQRRWLSGEVLQRQSDYWRQTLSGAPALLALPTDRPRPAQQDYAGRQIEITLDERLTAGLNALCQRHGVTLYMALTGAWAMLMARLSGQADVVIGSPVANRGRAEIEDLIGMFVNTLALRIDTSGELSTEALLAQVKARTLEAQAHQDLPFEQVVDIVKPERSLAHSPLFQTLFSWESRQGERLVLDNLALEGVAEPSHFAKFDLSLTLREAQGELRGTLECATALFDEATVVRYFGYLQRLLQAMASDDHAVLEQVPMLAEDERQALLFDLNATDVDYDLQQTIHGLFEAQALRTPQAVAVKSGDRSLSYAELNRQANRLARHLRGLGVGPDARVGICVERSPEMVVGLLAILKAGGGYVPLDPAYPAERLAYMLDDSAPLAVLVHGATRSVLGESAAQVVDLDEAVWASQPADNLSAQGLTPQHMAYVIYTSGSTGQPKGVINEHSGVVNRLLWMQDAYRLSAEDTVLQKTPFSFDVSVWEFFWPLMTGARLVMARPEGHKDPQYLSDIIAAERVTTLHFVPSMLDVFLAHGDTARCAGLRQVMCSGEALPGSLVRRFKRQLPGIGLHNLYGPTEAAVDVTAWDCAGPLDTTPDNTPIGKPIANTRMYILDGQRQPVPLGVVGELYIGGVQVARGYLNRAPLSAERFLEDPFRPQGRMYRTGDVARWLADGNIEYLGRNDDQVKIRGLRIELGEIQSRLSALDGVQEAAVLAREDVPGDKRLVAYYTGTAQSVEDLRTRLLEHLPDYMVPALFVHLNAWPLSPNGKLDRKALPAPDQAAASVRQYEAPVGETEITLAQLWCELLNVERVGRHDHFFELGGHSLLAVNLVARMRRAGLTADVRVLFNQPTLAALAAAVGGAPEAEVPANRIAPDCRRITPELLPLVALEQADIDRIVAGIPGGAANVQDIYPLAPLQAGILFHHLTATEGDPYVLQAQFAFADEQRLNAFAEALQHVIDRHDILRTSFYYEGLDEPVQVVWRQASLVSETLELDAEAGDALTQLRARFNVRHYRMAVDQAPLLRVVHAWDADNRRVVALLLFHHLVMDHVALEVLQHEMNAVLLGHEQHLAEPVPYRNHVARAHSGLDDRAHEAFFRAMLGDVEEATVPYGRHAAQGGETARAHLTLDNPLSRTLRRQARRLGISVASLIHLAWAQVLGQLAGRDDVVFGTVLLGRLHGGEGVERSPGVFVNTLPLRIGLTGQTVKAAALAVQQRLSQLLEHEHVQLALVQHCSAMAPGTPLFGTLLNYRHSAPQGAASAEAERAWQGMRLLEAEEHTNYPVTLSVDDLGEDFSLTALTGAGIEARRICGYMHGALERLALALEQSPNLPIDQLTILTAAEREQVLHGFNATAADYPQGLTTQQRFEAQAAQRPDAVAAAFLGEQLTYADLNRRANALARHLTGLGVRPDDRVAIVARRGLDTLVGLVAILKAGAGYVPVDPAHPAERLEYLLSDSAPVAVLTQSSLRGRLPALAVPVLDLDLQQWPADDTGNPQIPGLTPGHLAYVIYTSGSTGLPKGVMVEHQTLGNLIDWHCAAFDLCAGRHTSSLAGFGFDAMAWEVWPALCAGATLHLAPVHDGTEDIDALLGWWRGQPLDVSFLPTPVAEYAFGQNLEHPTLRTLLIGGDRLRQFGRSQTFDVINNYGPTEATVVATSGLIEAGQTLHIGRPVANATVYLLDEQQRPVPIGVAGELYVGGAGVARGYLNRPELTEERFLQDPFNPGRMYRTGDLARWREDGSIEYLGRNDDQVKIRGVRIELGEIENRLNHLPGIQEAVLLAREDEPGQVRLVAYFTAQTQVEPLEVGELRTHLLTQLPEYMVPSAFVRLEALPLTANGKLDRKALPKPERSALFTREYEVPQGELENALAQVWAEVLQVERVGRHDHFFELGGHSLLAMRMVSQVRQRLGVDLALSDLFANAELAAVAEVLSRAGRSTLPDIVPAPRDQALPLSFAQQRLWFLAQMEGGNTAYNVPFALRLRGRFDEDALQRSLARIVARHETLRSRFAAVNDGPQVLIMPDDSGLLLQVEDLRHVERPEHVLQVRIEREAREPFSLQDDPLIRGRLLRMADDHHVLLLTMHHIISDGWSMGVLTRELTALYQAFSHGEPDPLPPLALQYTDYAVWQRRWLSGEVLQRQSDYWQQALAGAPTLLSLPTDRPRPARQAYAGGSVEVILDAPLSAGLKALSQRHGVTLYMVMMSAWAMLLGRLSGQTDVVIGSPVANRSRAEIEGLIGMFVNTLALRIDTSGELSTEALLAQVKARTLEAQAHQDLPFEQVVDIVKPERSLAHSPLFQTLLGWDSSVAPALALGELTLEGLAGQNPVAKFDLSLTLGEARGVIGGSLEYATALFDEATVQRFVGYFRQLLRAMVGNDQAILERVEILSEDERRILLLDFNATTSSVAADGTVHGRFEAQALRTPLAVAVQSGDQALNYTELNHQANRLARHLRGLGVGPDARVAICVERSPELLVGLLAILKAGGAYVPLDPAYPAERLAYMLADSAPVAVLVHGATRSVLGESAAQVVDLDKAVWASQPDDNLSAEGLTPQHLAYVIYTSGTTGTTGTPKGVMVEHRSLNNLLHWSAQLCPQGEGHALLQKTPFSFDASVWELFWPLTAGMRLVLASPEGHRDPAYLVQVIRERQVGVVQFVPALLQQFLDVEQVGQCASLTDIVCGGGELTEALVRSVRERLPQVRLHNVYGPTEATVDSTVWTLEPGAALPEGAPPIGKPVSSTRVYLLDGHGRPVPRGAVGELCIGGVQVARGYFNRADLTAERFLKDPFSEQADARIYRSGDLARHRADGNIEYLGRNDDQVKIRGLRIELGEIQACLLQAEGVREALVLAREDAPGDVRLIAYYTVGEHAPAIESLHAHLHARLPAYMVPSAWVRLDAWPLSPNGKVDRSALPAPDQASVIVREYEAPVGETEITLARLWCELLNVERVGRHDHFFELGGHSLLAVNLAARMRRAGLAVDVHALFSQPTLAALAAAVSSAPEVEVPANRITPDCRRITPELLPLVALDQAAIDRIIASIPGGAANVQDIYPLAPLQAGILFHHLSATQGDPYVLQAQFAFADEQRLNTFVETLQRVIERHDILRTSLFHEGLDEPVQVVWRRAPLVCEALDIGGGDALAQLRARFDVGHYRMAVDQAPLMRVVHAWDADNRRVVALLLFHHLVMDHVALQVLQHEMNAVLLDRVEQLPAPVPYRNHVAQTRLGLGEQEHLAFFSEMLGDVDEPTVPFGQGTADDLCTGHSQQSLDRGLSLRVRTQARQLGVSAASLMHLAWAQVLGQLSGRDDVVFGTVLLGRLNGGEGVERALGVFINTLPLRVEMTGQTVKDGVLAVHERLNRLLRHEQASLALAQRCSGIASGAPLFNALLNYRHSGAAAAPSAETGAAWEGMQLLNAEEHSSYRLSLSVDDLGEDFSLTALTAAGIEAERICRYMLQAVGNLVQALEQTPQLQLDRLSILPDTERTRLLSEFNATFRKYPAALTVHRLFEWQAEEHPHAVAAVHGAASVTYAELNRWANRLAHHLIEHGVEPGDNVAILLPRSLDLLAAQLAISKCAAAYVPLDINAPAERQAFMVQDCEAMLLLTFSGEEADHPVLRIDLDTLALDGQPTHDPNLPQSSESLAYIMYTSGSTGAPKGVMVPHRAIGRLAINNGYADFNPQDRVAFASNPAFDASTMDVWGPLLNGGRVVVIDHRTLLDPALFGRELAESGVTVLFVTTALFNQYVQLIPQALKGLRILLCGGERGDPAAFRRLRAEAPDLRIVHCYGPTETTTYATTFEVQEVATDAESVSIGGPISNTQVYVLDARQQPVPFGVTGELYIGGQGVAMGYLNRPDLTAEKFLKDPFCDHPGALLYRTGDLARWIAPGQLECLGRNDDQVKVRGFRIELGEIENRLLGCAGLKEAVVLARRDGQEPLRLVAYYSADDASVDSAGLRAQLQARLPDYMVPSAWVRLDALPLNNNGKVDRKALPAPEQDALLTCAYEAPATALEQTLAQVWAEVLQVERVGRHDHFFELGGHSLLAMRMVSQVRQRLGVELALSDLFANAELAAVAEVLSRSGRSTLPDIVPAPRDQALPLSFAQQRLWFLAQMEGGNTAYNVPFALRLRGRFDEDALQRSLARIVARHETLRSRFAAVNDGPQVLIMPDDSGLLLQVEDLRHVERPEHVLQVRIEREAREPFSLQDDPLIRGRLLRMADDHHVLLLTMHHIISDGWSMGVLTRELTALYQAFSRGEADPLPPLALQYSDYAVWQRRWLSGEVLQRQSDYWQQALAGAPTLLTLPTDRPRPARQDHAGGSVEVWFDAGLSAGLKALCQRHGVTPYMVMMGTWAVLMTRLSGQSEVVVGSPVANRIRAEIEGLIGMFVNTLALRIDTSGGLSGAALLARVKACTLEAQAHQDLPFEQVVEVTRPVRSLSHSPLFQTLLGWDSSMAPALALGELTLEGIAEPSRFVKFDLSMRLGETPDGVRGALTYATALFDEATVQRFVGYFKRLLQAMVEDDQAVLDRVDLLGPQERQRVLGEFNATETAYDLEQTVHELFQAQVSRTPDAVAVAAGPQRLTYRELNAQANRLAHHLRSQGVQPDARVAICVERGLDLVVGLLAILKAGGAYVPLDPGYPADRLAYMLKDSAPVAVLVHPATRPLFDGADSLLIDFDRCTWQDAPAHDVPVPGLSAGHLAYMIYTSGSTGTPKGVMLQHRGLCNLVHWGSQICPPTASAALLQKAPFSFDGSVWEFFWPLTSGVRLELARPDGHRDPAYLARVIRERQITVVKFVPALLEQFLELEEAGQCTSLTDVFCGGGELTAALARAVRRRLPWVRLHNVYGPTEATVDSTAWTLEPDRPVPESELPIGKAICNTRLYVLDANDLPVPLGVSGQLHIGGVGGARGYMNLPQLQAERFIDSPFVAGDRLYRTGDLVRYRTDGNLEFLGRNDFQVKLHGLRLELGEIEARLIEHPALRTAVVLMRDERLVAYFTLRTGSEMPTAEALRAHITQRLPEYMAPGAFVPLDALPLSPNGKVDRQALPAPDAEVLRDRPYVAPQGETEQAVAQIWAELLDIGRVGRHDSFFELGGHSLLAIRLINQMKQAGLAVTLAELFQSPTVEGVCTRLAGRQEGEQQPDGLIVVRPGDQGTPLFLVHEFSGREMYFPALALHIGGDFPVYGLPGVTLGQPQLRTVECMAARMIGIMRSVQPHGPYRLAGWSFGGLLSYEIAQQLIGMDEPVAFVGLIDTYAPHPAHQDKSRWTGEHLDRHQLLQHCRAYSLDRGEEGEAALAQVALLEAEIERLDFNELFARCRDQQLSDPELSAAGVTDAWHYFDREAAHGQALEHYRVSPASQAVHLFRAQDLMPGQEQPDPLRGWGGHVPQDLLRCIDVPGDHRTLMKPPLVQAMGHALTQALEAAAAPEPASYQPLLTIQSGHPGHAPIFCVPGAGDNVIGFVHLTEALGPEWPIFGLQPRGLDGVTVPHSRVEAAAAFYVQALGQLYPQGPVHLIGHSFGGWVAYAMAALLQAQGREVASLSLIDSESPGGNGVAGKPYTATAALQRLVESLQLASGKSLGIDPPAFAEADGDTQMRLLHRGMVRAGILSERSSPQAMDGPVRTFATALRTVYRPALAYTGPLRLALVDDPTLDAAGNQREQAAMVEGWRRQATDLAVWYGPGNHFTILKAPNVFSLAAWWHDGLTVPAGQVLS